MVCYEHSAGSVQKGIRQQYAVRSAEQRTIDCNTGNYAESDNPETWTTFDKALEYVREHGGTTIAYALDGKDNVSCVDIDRCFNENGELSETAKEALKRSGATYAEKSVSGNGLANAKIEIDVGEYNGFV